MQLCWLMWMKIIHESMQTFFLSLMTKPLNCLSLSCCWWTQPNVVRKWRIVHIFSIVIVLITSKCIDGTQLWWWWWCVCQLEKDVRHSWHSTLLFNNCLSAHIYVRQPQKSINLYLCRFWLSLVHYFVFVAFAPKSFRFVFFSFLLTLTEWNSPNICKLTQT